jgi:hypothetical protein
VRRIGGGKQVGRLHEHSAQPLRTGRADQGQIAGRPGRPRHPQPSINPSQVRGSSFRFAGPFAGQHVLAQVPGLLG